MSEYIYQSRGEPLVNERGEIYLARTGEIVRCRECMHMHTVRNWLGVDVDECWLHADRESGALGIERTEPDGFCAWGEKASNFTTCKCGEDIETNGRESVTCPSCGRVITE